MFIFVLLLRLHFNGALCWLWIYYAHGFSKKKQFSELLTSAVLWWYSLILIPLYIGLISDCSCRWKNDCSASWVFYARLVRALFWINENWNVYCCCVLTCLILSQIPFFLFVIFIFFVVSNYHTVLADSLNQLKVLIFNY